MERIGFYSFGGCLLLRLQMTRGRRGDFSVGVDASHPTGGVVLTVEPPAPRGEQFLSILSHSPMTRGLALLVRPVRYPCVHWHRFGFRLCSPT